MAFWNFDPHQPCTASRRPIGPARFIEALFQSLAGLLLCNLLFLLCCLPLVTIGPACVALHRVCCLALRGHGGALPAAFLRSFKQNFAQGLALGFTGLPILCWLACTALAAASQGRFGLLAGAGAALVVLAGIWGYALLLAAHMELSFPLLLKNAAALWAAGRHASVAGSVLALAILCAGALWFPASLPLLFLLGFSLACFSFCFFGWKTAERHIFLPYYRRHPEEAAAQGYRFDREGNPV